MAATGYQRFFAELKRRKVFRVAAVYGVVAFGVLQVADILVPALHLPESFTTGVALLAILGFPIAVVLAWAFESTPGGIKRTDIAATGEIEAIVAQPPASRWPSGLLALVGIVALLVGGWLALSSRAGADSTGAVSTGEVGGDRVAMEADPGGAVGPPRTAVAVLPFQSLTDDEESREFALGIHDDLLTQLTRIDDLRVTSRTSVMTYVDSDKPVREIAAELGVGSVVEGGVRTAGDQVRINVQLIDATTDEHLWAETYDRELTAENVFGIQGEIARAVTGALEAELSEQEVAALAELPTSSTEAWAAYHRARRLWGTTGGLANDRQIVAEYQRAVELDPEFVAAWAGLVRGQSWLIRMGYQTDTIPARRSLDRLLALGSESPEALLAESYFRYYALADFDGALKPVQEYRRLRPGDAEGWQTEGWVLRRVGRWDESTAAQQQGARLDPVNALVSWNLAVNHRRDRRYDEAGRAFEFAAGLTPENTLIRMQWYQNELFGEGDVESASRIAGLLRSTASPDAAAVADYWLALAARDYGAAASAVRDVEPDEFLIFLPAGDEWFELPKSLLLALAERLAGNDEEATAWADSAVREARSEIESRPVPDGGDRFGVAAIARSILAVGLALRKAPGDAGEARETADAAVRMYGMDRDEVDGYSIEQLRIWTRAILGDDERVLELIEGQLARPSDLGPGQLRHIPIYDGLRGDPQFESLIKRADALVMD